MSDNRVSVRFTGRTGATNFDVAKEVGGNAVLENGKVYEVSEKLAKRLAASAGWEPVKAGKEKKEATDE